jgi:uncharacterized protein (TIGR03086 family)
VDRVDDHPMVGSLGAAVQAWRVLLDRLTAAELALATANPGWNVAQVINHSIAVTCKFTAFAAGETDRPHTPDQDFLGADHRLAFDNAADQALEAWRQADVRRSCHLPFGTFPAILAAGINLFDLLAHGWDIRQTTGAPFNCPDAAWHAGLEAAEKVIGEQRDPRHYAPELPAPPGASAQIRLLSYLGRHTEPSDASP